MIGLNFAKTFFYLLIKTDCYPFRLTLSIETYQYICKPIFTNSDKSLPIYQIQKNHASVQAKLSGYVLETFRSVWKLPSFLKVSNLNFHFFCTHSRMIRHFPNCLKTFRIVFKLFMFSRCFQIVQNILEPHDFLHLPMNYLDYFLQRYFQSCILEQEYKHPVKRKYIYLYFYIL